MTDIIHEGVPIPWARPRFNNGRGFTPEKQADAKESLQWAFISSEKTLFDKDRPLEVSLVFSFIPPAKSRPKQSESVSVRHKPTKPDIDNLIKLVLDAGNGALWLDDNQVSRVIAEKVFGDRAYTHIKVKGL